MISDVTFTVGRAETEFRLLLITGTNHNVILHGGSHDSPKRLWSFAFLVSRCQRLTLLLIPFRYLFQYYSNSIRLQSYYSQNISLHKYERLCQNHTAESPSKNTSNKLCFRVTHWCISPPTYSLAAFISTAWIDATQNLNTAYTLQIKYAVINSSQCKRVRM